MTGLRIFERPEQYGRRRDNRDRVWRQWELYLFWNHTRARVDTASSAIRAYTYNHGLLDAVSLFSFGLFGEMNDWNKPMTHSQAMIIWW